MHVVDASAHVRDCDRCAIFADRNDDTDVEQRKQKRCRHQIGDLPGLEELKGSGLIEGSLPTGFAVPIPSDDTTLRDDEDPLDPGDLDLALAPAVESAPEQASEVAAAPANPAEDAKPVGEQ